MMIRIYVIPTIPAWNSWHTPLSFVSTTICLGLLTLLVFQFTGVAIIDEQFIKQLMVLLMLILFIETAAGFFHQFRLQKLNTGIDDLVFDQGVFFKIFLLRAGLLTIAFLAIFTLVLERSLLPGSSYDSWLYPLSVLIIMQELVGRLLFYSAYFRVGV